MTIYERKNSHFDEYQDIYISSNNYKEGDYALH